MEAACAPPDSWENDVQDAIRGHSRERLRSLLTLPSSTPERINAINAQGCLLCTQGRMRPWALREFLEQGMTPSSPPFEERALVGLSEEALQLLWTRATLAQRFEVVRSVVFGGNPAQLRRCLSLEVLSPLGPALWGELFRVALSDNQTHLVEVFQESPYPRLTVSDWSECMQGKLSAPTLESLLTSDVCLNPSASMLVTSARSSHREDLVAVLRAAGVPEPPVSVESPEHEGWAPPKGWPVSWAKASPVLRLRVWGALRLGRGQQSRSVARVVYGTLLDDDEEGLQRLLEWGLPLTSSNVSLFSQAVLKHAHRCTRAILEAGASLDDESGPEEEVFRRHRLPWQLLDIVQAEDPVLLRRAWAIATVVQRQLALDALVHRGSAEQLARLLSLGKAFDEGGVQAPEGEDRSRWILENALRGNRPDMVELLCRHGLHAAAVSVDTVVGCTPETVAVLLRHAPGLVAPPLWLKALQRERGDLVDVLLDAGASVSWSLDASGLPLPTVPAEMVDWAQSHARRRAATAAQELTETLPVPQAGRRRRL